jgi:HEAT repeat protein
MMNAMGSGSRAGRRASFHMLVAAAAQDLSEVLKAALQLEDPVIRLWAARLAAAGLEQGKLRAVLHGLLRDPSAPVRREALRTWTAAFPEEAVSQQVLALSDRSASVRNEARFQLREKGEPYFQQLYRDALTAARPASLAVAIAGLGETGALSEAETLIPYLSHESARVRGAAVGSLIQLGGDRYVDLVMNRVMDASSAVSMRARKAVQWHIARIGGPRLWLSLSESRVAHVRRNLLHLIAALPKWDSITYLVQATQDDDERITELAQDYTNSWNQRYDRSQTTPTRKQLALLQAALARAENALPAGVVALIRFVLRPFAAK